MKYIRQITFILIILILIGFCSCEKDSYFLEPVLDYEIQLTDSIAPTNVAFLNTSKNLEHFEWDFGDGSISHEKSPIHSFNEDGEYTIVLSAWNDNEQFTIQKTIYLLKAYQYFITNNSNFGLYNVTCYSNDSSLNCLPVNHGLLNAHESSENCQIKSENLYISFEDNVEQKYRTAFPFSLKKNILNEVIIDKNTLVIVNR